MQDNLIIPLKNKTMKKILLCTDGSTFSQSSYQYVSWLAPRLNAATDVLYVTDIRSQKVASMGNWSGSIGFDTANDLLEQIVELEHQKAKLNQQRAQLILQAAQKCLASQGVGDVKTIHETGFLVDSFHKFEAQADLIVLGKRGEHAQFATKHLGSNTERIIRASHKPCLITPLNYQPIERILLAYDDSKSCQKVLQFLVSSPAFKDLELHLLTVAKKEDDPKAIEYLNSGREKLEKAGLNPICYVLQGDPEIVISNYIKSHSISLLVMGAYGHSRIRSLIIGGTTVQMLRSTHIPVLLYR